MKNIAIAVAAVLALSTVAANAQPLCEEGTAPEGWLRDGGFCEQVADLTSLLSRDDNAGEYTTFIHGIEYEHGKPVS